MIRYLVFEFETPEPAIAEMKSDLLAQPPLEADAIAVADDEHSDHQLRVDRGSADVAVERRQLLAKVSQHPRHDWVDAAQEMIRGNVFFEVEKIEQLALINRLTTHHDLRPSLKSFRRRNHDSPISTRTFSTASTQKRHASANPIARRTRSLERGSRCSNTQFPTEPLSLDERALALAQR